MKPLFSALAPAGARAALQVLIFHRVLPGPDPLFPEDVWAERFDEICRWVKGWCTLLPLDEAVERLARGDLPPRSMSITFDDGYADNRTVAAPILRQHGLPCTFFVATGFLDGGRMWNDTLIEAVRKSALDSIDLRGLGIEPSRLSLGSREQRRQAVDLLIRHAKYMPGDRREAFVDAVAGRAAVRPATDLMMTTVQVKELRQFGFQIGAHTVNHPILRALPRADARREIEESRRRLEQVLGARVNLFAYPNGRPGEDYSEESVSLVREAGFDAAVCTAWGVSTRSTDRFQLRRFTPWDRQRWRFGARLAANLLRRGR